MNENERKILLEKYLVMPEKELNEMLMEPESEYREGIFPLLLEAAKSRGLGSNKEKIIKKSIFTKNEIEQKDAGQNLSPQQRRLFTILPGIAFWYSCFAPAVWKQRKREALRCQMIGSRAYLLAGLICVVGLTIFSSSPASSDEILLIILLAIMLCGISIYLFFQKKKHNEQNLYE